MTRIVYVIIKHDCANDKSIQAICSTRAKAEAMLKELVADPPCSAPIREECECDGTYAHVANKHGWWADYRIEEMWLDEWID